MDNREFNKYLERVKRDLDILKTYHDLGAVTAPDKPTDSQTEKPSRTRLRQKIISKKQKILDEIESTEGIAARTKQYWKDKLVNIDLFNADAENKVQELIDLLEKYYNNLPSDYGGYRTDVTLLEMNIGIIETDLLLLNNLCFDYKYATDYT